MHVWPAIQLINPSAAVKTNGLREHGVVYKHCRDCLRVALLYPSIYRAAVASLAYQTAYYLLNSMEGVVAERFVASKLAGEEPPPRSLETKTPLTRFDIVVVFMGFELDYVNYARIMLAAGLDPLKARRRDGPVVVLGGPVAAMNPIPALEFSDMVLVGDAEPLLEKLASKAYELGARAAIEELQCSNGFLTKNCGKPIAKLYAHNLDKTFHPITEFRIPGSGEPWGEAYMVEVSRGCPYACRFCMEARFLHPLRHRSYGRIAELVVKGLEANGVRRVAFYALSFFSHPDADKLLSLVVDELKAEATIGSLRADTLTRDRVEALAKAGQRVLTVAPETIDRNICSVIGKCIDKDVVEELAEEAWRHGMHLKIYLMVGLPGETDESVEAEAEWLKELSRRAPPRREAIRVSVNPLIPKPWTPFQRLALIDREAYERRIKILKRAESKVLRVDALSYRYAYAETIIARGDEKIAQLIREWASLGGRLGQLNQAARKLGINTERYAGRGIEPRWMKLVRPLAKLM